MSWRNAKAIDQLIKQVNAAYPKRRKDSDGTIGDESHSSRSSDHNPNDAGVVCAVDFTDEHGKSFEALALAEAIKDDPRVHYVIHDRKTYNASIAKYWRPYSGSSPHDEHVHISFKQNAKYYDDAKPFNFPATNVKPYENFYWLAVVTYNENQMMNLVDFCTNGIAGGPLKIVRVGDTLMIHVRETNIPRKRNSFKTVHDWCDGRNLKEMYRFTAGKPDVSAV